MLANLTNLEALWFSGNNITDISVVAGLTNLTDLRLSHNNVTDISAVSGLTSLTSLGLGNNNISDISALANLTNLTTLVLDRNNISDVSVLKGLTNITKLMLHDNDISDVSVLANLTNLTTLWLYNNYITDISPLIANTGLGNGDNAHLAGNALTYSSIYTHIPILQERGVHVAFNNRTPTNIVKRSEENNKNMVVVVHDEKNMVFEGVPVAFSVKEGDGQVSVEETTTDSEGKASSTFIPGTEMAKNTVEVTVSEIKQSVTFNFAIQPLTLDVNGDNLVNILDLLLVSSNIGEKEPNPAADVNRDGLVNILDLVLVSQGLEH